MTPPEELTTLLHLERLGSMSTAPTTSHEPLIGRGWVERLDVTVGRFVVPRVRITEAGRNVLRDAGFRLRERKK